MMKDETRFKRRAMTIIACVLLAVCALLVCVPAFGQSQTPGPDNWPDYARVVYHARDDNMDASKIMLEGASIQLSEGTAHPADKASPRTDQNSMIAHEQLLEKARSGRID